MPGPTRFGCSHPNRTRFALDGPCPRVVGVAVLLASGAPGCSGPELPDLPFEPPAAAEREPDAARAPAEPGASAVRLPFAVDDHFHPTGCMSSEGDCGSPRLSIDTGRCRTPRPEGAQGQCYHFRYEPTPGARAGQYVLWLWQYGDNNWGASPGLAIEPGARRIRFAAAASSPLWITFRAGGTNLPRQADERLGYQDDFLRELELELSEELARYEIPLDRVAYASVISGFGWMLVAPTQEAPVEFFVDDIRWE